MTLKPLLTPAVIMSAIFLSACESKWSKMPDDELAAKSAECMAETNPSTARIQVCKNYERECERRRSKGIYVC